MCLQHERQVDQGQASLPFIPDDISEIGVEARVCTGRKERHLFGGIHINYLLYFFIPLLIFACLLCYWVAVLTKEEKPFPHTTITDTACHYPQDIVFRGLMLPAGSFVTLIYYIAFKWLESKKKQIEFPYSTESWIAPWAIISVGGFYCAIGTIDGAGYPDIHTIGAVFFFIVLFVTAGAITFVLREMRKWNSSCISRKSIMVKSVLILYILGVAVYCLTHGLIEEDVDL
jgi:hypothetical protein